MYYNSNHNFSRFSRLFIFVFFISFSGVKAQQATPVAQNLNDYVDLLTGDFNYGLPLMNVPGPNGEQVNISLGYGAGVRMEDAASWTGLGWGYNPGEITRNIKGVSDDWKNASITNTSIKYTGSTWTMAVDNTFYYGPLYFKSINYSSSQQTMDVYASNRKLSDGLFYFPDYDSYNVSGPGIGGTMQPRFYEYASYHMKSDPASYIYTNTFPSSSEKAFTTTPGFVFTNDINSPITSRAETFRPDDPQDAYASFYPPQPTTTYPIFSGKGFNSTTKKAITSYYVEFFTNTQINTQYATLKSQGFLDYRIITGTRRPATDFGADDVGAFRIVTPDGFVYHYSLPVYMLENEKMFSFMLNSAFGVNSNDEHTELLKAARYATSWKLTAVTGPDYVDANNNGIADNGDTGYWIAYNYGLWTNAFSWRAPYFNFQYDLYAKALPSNYRTPRYERTQYKTEGTVSSGKAQMYYLNSIQTATHTAFFVKDIRLDNHSVKETGNIITPQLRLSKVVLMRNEDIPEMSVSATLPTDSRFSLSGCNVTAIIPHLGNYQANEATIKAKALQIVDLVYNYSLCKKVYNNINNTFTTAPAYYTYNTGSGNVQKEMYQAFNHTSGVFSSSDLANSGKLTLKEVIVYGANGMKAMPSFKFDYNEANSAKNPDYHVFKTDYWGYYKSDFDMNYRGRYTTDGSTGSSNNIDAWSLKKVQTPLGGELLIDYESDRYERVNYGNGFEFPLRTFLIQSGTTSSPNYSSPGCVRYNWNVNVTEEISKYWGSPSITRTSVFIPFGNTNSGPSCPTKLTAKGFNPASSSSNPAVSVTSVSNTATSRTLAISNLEYSCYPQTCANTSITPSYSSSGYGWGYVSLSLSQVTGGGLRVKQLSLKDIESGQVYANEYTYTNGYASSEPTELNIISGDFSVEKNTLYGDRHIIQPTVTYQQVTIKEKSANNTYAGKAVYEFQTAYDPFSVTQFQGQITQNAPDDALQTTFIAEDRFSGFGKLLRSTTYDQNNIIMANTTYEYEYTSCIEQESFHQIVKLPDLGSTAGGALNLHEIYTKEIIHARLKKVTSYRDGITTTSETLERDPITGEAIRQRTIDPTNGIRDIVVRPAYYDYPGMGAKSVNATNSNILTPFSKTEQYQDAITRDLLGEVVSTNPKLIGGKKITWRQANPMLGFNTTTQRYSLTNSTTSYWAPHKTYRFNGNTNDLLWEELSENIALNRRMAPVTVKTLNNRYVSKKFGYDNQYLICEMGNAQYGDFAFSGFEDVVTVAPGVLHFGGDISNGASRMRETQQIQAHTGQFMAKVDGAQYGPTYSVTAFTTGRSYRASVWVHKSSPANASLVMHLNGRSGVSPNFIDGYNDYKIISLNDPKNIIVGDWILMTLTLDVPSTYAPSTGTTNDFRVYVYNPGSTPAYFDDLSLRPVDNEFTGMVYDTYGRQVAQINSNGFATKYKYDDTGRLIEVWTETPQGWILERKYNFNFARGN